MKWLLRVAMVGIAAFALWRVWQWVFVTDEMRVRKQIAIMESAVEKGKLLKAQARLGHRDRCPTPVRSQRPDEELECDRRGRTRTDAPIAVKQLFETL